MSKHTILTLLAAASLLATDTQALVEPVLLSQYPQKTRTFYPLDSRDVPPLLCTDAVPLPVGEVTAAAHSRDGATWLGTKHGLVRIDESVLERDRHQYLAGLRYLPDDEVRQIIPDTRSGVWVRTRTGISHIELVLMPLLEKARLYEARIRARHDRYGLISDSVLGAPGDIKQNRLIDNDNDGLWTSIYAAAECFRYRVTHEQEALMNARKSIEAMLFLEEVTGIKGFPARSYVRKGDPMPTDGEWHWTQDGNYYWKGDTSSDEIVGHFFMYGVAHDSLPDGGLKRRVVEAARRVMDHIIEHDYKLVGPEGRGTTWGWWGPKKVAAEPDEHALNSLQLLSFLKTAAHLTHDQKYEAEYRKAAWEWHYAEWITKLKDYRLEMNYSDEELAFLPLYSLFVYEKDPRLKEAYQKAGEAWWENIHREANPLWTFIYAKGHSVTQAEMNSAAWTLIRQPLDTIKWSVHNSSRQDIVLAVPVDRFGKREALTLLPPDERPIMRWNSNPFVVDSGEGGMSEDDGAAFLLPYWMGRYEGFLKGE